MALRQKTAGLARNHCFMLPSAGFRQATSTLYRQALLSSHYHPSAFFQRNKSKRIMLLREYNIVFLLWQGVHTSKKPISQHFSPIAPAGGRKMPVFFLSACPKVRKRPVWSVHHTGLSEQKPFYFAKSETRVSRITFTRICPGYSISFSIFLATSRARTFMPSSLTSSGLTIILTSRPDWIA